jgi:hypothetical protein
MKKQRWWQKYWLNMAYTARLQRRKIFLVAIFFIGFSSTALAYAVVASEPNWLPGWSAVGTATSRTHNVRVNIVDAYIETAYEPHPHDRVAIKANGQNLSFQLTMRGNENKWVFFYLQNTGMYPVVLSKPSIAHPDNSPLQVTWPWLEGVTLAVGEITGPYPIHVRWVADNQINHPTNTQIMMSLNYVQAR